MDNEIINNLTKFETSIINGDVSKLWTDNNKLQNCWSMLSCERKSCPAYGRKKVRCWHITGTHCRGKNYDINLSKKWSDCKNCQVFKASTPTKNLRVAEFFNNIIFSLKCFDPVSLKNLIIKKNFNQIVEKYRFTTRETEVLLLILDRSTRKEIAQAMNISDETVKMHFKNIYKKLGINSLRSLFTTLVEFCESIEKDNSPA